MTFSPDIAIATRVRPGSTASGNEIGKLAPPRRIEVAAKIEGANWAGDPIVTSVIGGFLGGVAGAATAVLVTELIKRILAVVSSQDMWGLIGLPLAGLALAVLILQGYDHGRALQTDSSIAGPPAHPRTVGAELEGSP